MNFIKKIFDGKTDEETHLQFQRFGKGEFRNRALIQAKKSGEKITLKTSAEFGNEFVKMVAKKLSSNQALVKGAIVSTLDLKDDLNPKDVKQFQGIKRYLIEREMSGEEILEILKDFPKAFFGLSFKSESTELKIKPKAPKSGKPSSKNEGKPKADFCTIKTSDDKIANELVFEKENWKTASINHTFFIDQIIIPEELKNEKDYKVIRERALRKGRIVRDAIIDGKMIKSEKEFLV